MSTAAGAGAGSFLILIGATVERLAPEQRSFAAGLMNASGSPGQFAFAQPVQLAITAAGWGASIFGLAAASLLTLPLAWPLRRKPAASAEDDAAVGTLAMPAEVTLRE